MFQPKHPAEPFQRRALFVGNDSSMNRSICDYFQMMGCLCAVVSPKEALRRIEREKFDVVLFDLSNSSIRQEQVILTIRESRPALLERILVISSSAKADAHEYLKLPVIFREKPLSELWAQVEEIFAAQQSPQMVPSGMISAQLVFDSFHAPSPAGLRGPLKSARQLTYQHQSTTINLLVHPNREEDYRISIVGQVLDVSMRAVHDLPVVLSNKNRTLAKASTSQFGEFVLEFDFVEHAGIQIRLSEGSWIFMPLGNIGSKGSSIPEFDAGT
jgi:DNA-binding response OmpR family regulator